MREEKWQDFYRSGRIIDYLSYKAYADEVLDEAIARHGLQRARKEDIKPDAGICRSNRDDNWKHSDGRI